MWDCYNSLLYVSYSVQRNLNNKYCTTIITGGRQIIHLLTNYSWSKAPSSGKVCCIVDEILRLLAKTK